TSLRSLLSGAGSPAAQAARIARVQRANFRRQRAARIGPDLSHRRTILARVLSTRAVRAAVAAEMRDKHLPRRKALLVAKGYVEEIAANYSHVFITFMEGFLGRLWNRLYDGVTFSHSETLREVARDAEIVFAPCHRSHMDYLLLSYVIYKQGYAVPHIAAGINLNIPIVGRLLRKGGAAHRSSVAAQDGHDFHDGAQLSARSEASGRVRPRLLWLRTHRRGRHLRRRTIRAGEAQGKHR
ncbi:MAG: hypothetical protein EBU76_02860, partial [Gammaproteobacteria bacterium]|nr:hypothetical protein [Gammaproteobacteria bacterium]